MLFMLVQPTKFNIRKNVKGFPFYSVDIYGECRSLIRNAPLAYSKTKDGYVSVRFCKKEGKEKIHKRFLLHRLVKSAFCGFDESKTYIDHKDDNPANNELTNLRWVTQSENIKKSYGLGRSVAPRCMAGKFGKLHPNSTPIAGYDKDGKDVVYFESISLARAAGYNVDFYRKASNKKQTECKGLIFKRVSNAR